MTDYGVTATGFVAKPLLQIQEDIIGGFQAAPALGPTLDYGTASALGQLAGVVAGSISEVWELGADVRAAADPEAAVAVSLTNDASLTGTTRRAAAATIVHATVNLDAGITLPAGSLATITGRPDRVFESVADVSNPGGSPADIPCDFVCTVTGPIDVSPGTLTVISTAVSGWNSVTNADAGVTGRAVDTDLQLRARRSAQLALRGGSTIRAIRAAVLAIPEVESCLVLENKSDFPDGNGLAPHSFEVVLDDGAVPAAADDDIAQAIFDHGDPAGIPAGGTSSGTATDAAGIGHTVRFTRVTRKDVYIAVTVTKNAALFPVDGADQIAAAIVAKGALYNPGDTVVRQYLLSQAFTVSGVTDVSACTLDYHPTPTGVINLTATFRERATFDAANVTVTVV